MNAIANVTNEILSAAILPHDEPFLRDKYANLLAMVENNPFGDRISYLLLNQEVGKKIVKNIYGDPSPSNCLGTAFWITCTSRLDYPYHAYENEIGDHTEKRTYEDHLGGCFICPENTPLGSIITSYCERTDDLHAGVYLGAIENEEIAFAQRGLGGDFCFEVISRNYGHPHFYKPKKRAVP